MSSQHNPTMRVLAVLELVSKGQGGYSLSEMSRQLGIPSSTLYPILHTLRGQKYLNYNENRQIYSLGVRLFEVGSRVQGTEFFREAISIMTNVVEACGETCHLGVLDLGDIFYLAKVDSPQPVRMYSIAGKRLPAYATALGKALLRGYSMEALRQLYPQGLKPLTAGTITDFEALHAQLHSDDIFFYESEECSESVCCIATPLYRQGVVVASCSVSLPLFRYNAQKRASIELALKEALTRFDSIAEQFVF